MKKKLICSTAVDGIQGQLFFYEFPVWSGQTRYNWVIPVYDLVSKSAKRIHPKKDGYLESLQLCNQLVGNLNPFKVLRQIRPYLSRALDKVDVIAFSAALGKKHQRKRVYAHLFEQFGFREIYRDEHLHFYTDDFIVMSKTLELKKSQIKKILKPLKDEDSE